ncbi:hypothetical protein IMCC9480_2527 [Oxalobacteraceae bacterium IMCC9480]|nr:hypothetical protein IMCC9480_2527 [Oxalobacteraceae bacterium IMCC9480]
MDIPPSLYFCENSRSRILSAIYRFTAHPDLRCASLAA